MATAVLSLLVKKASGIVDFANTIMNGGSAIANIDESHAEVHRGMSYTGGKVGTALGSGAKFYFIGQNNNPDGKSIHLTAAFASSAAVIVRTIATAGRTGGVTVLTVNRKTGLLDSGVATWWGATPDESSPTVIKEVYVPGGSGPHPLGGRGGNSGERIVPVDSFIGLEIENVSGSELDFFSIDFDFYLADPE